MKLNPMILSFILLPFIGFSQEFDGVKIEGSKKEFIKAMTDKGYSVIDETPTYVCFNGNKAHSDLVLYGYVSPVSQLIWKLSIALPKMDSWHNLKTQYYRYFDMLTEKYGEPAKQYADFSAPHYDGDENELIAVKSDKCNYFAVWHDIAIYMKIYTFGRVIINYENLTNSAANTREKKEADKRTF